MSTAEADTWFDGADSSQRGTLSDLRDLIRSVAPEAIEVIKWGRPCYSNAKGMFCYLQSTKSYATLGFQKGAALADPERLLEGTGKDMRHIKFRHGLDPRHPAVVALLRRAAAS